MLREIYMDNAATSFPKAPGVSDAMKRYLDAVGANIGRGSYGRCTDAGMTVLNVRESLAKAFGCADACLRMQRGGLCHVYTPHAQAVFAGTDALLIPAGERGASDLARFRAAWPDLRDPCWNPGLSDEQADYRFREATV